MIICSSPRIPEGLGQAVLVLRGVKQVAGQLNLEEV